MENSVFFWRQIPIKNVSLEVSDLKALFSVIQARQKIVYDRIFEEFKKKNTDKNEQEKDFIIEKFKDEFKTTIRIIMKDGNSISSNSNSIFDDSRVTDNIERIIIDPCEVHRNIYNKDYYPHARIEISLEDISHFNPSVTVSSGSQNESFFKVTGSDIDWCMTTIFEIQRLISQRNNYRYILHTKFVYDLFLYILIIPSLAYFIFLYNDYLLNFQQKYSIMFIYFFMTSIFFAVLFLYRFVYDAIRYLYPTVEIDKYVGSNRRRFRWLIGLIPFGYFSILIKNLLGL